MDPHAGLGAVKAKLEAVHGDITEHRSTPSSARRTRRCWVTAGAPRDLQGGRITPREVWAIYQTGDWQRLPSESRGVKGTDLSGFFNGDQEPV